ncbi:hypothetical protein [Mycobacterium antarcticum]|uniref:hypothetical protein n=1 Tax=Mycolicibacterium sp. TUM20984 TaxID=3023368 RepID=UPI0024E0ABCA|nr:hypothetical protein [Mycolicibacterium sp. TUM20984]
MIVRRVVQVTLTRTTEQTRTNNTSFPGTELWRVDWTERQGSKDDDHLTMSHYTEAAARQHVSGLLDQRVDGLSISEVYTEQKMVQ